MTYIIGHKILFLNGQFLLPGGGATAPSINMLFHALVYMYTYICIRIHTYMHVYMYKYKTYIVPTSNK